MSGERFVVEADRKVVEVVVRGREGFRFFASDPAYQDLEARTFNRARSIHAKAARMARAMKALRRPRSGSALRRTLH